MFDPNKPVQTRDGRKVRILCTDRRLDCREPIIGLVDDGNNGETLRTWWADGSHYKAHYGPNGVDLINIPERIQRTTWVNVYKRRHGEGLGLGGFHSSQSDALAQGGNRPDCLACIPIEIDCEVGEGLGEEEEDA